MDGPVISRHANIEVCNIFCYQLEIGITIRYWKCGWSNVKHSFWFLIIFRFRFQHFCFNVVVIHLLEVIQIGILPSPLGDTFVTLTRSWRFFKAIELRLFLNTKQILKCWVNRAWHRKRCISKSDHVVVTRVRAVFPLVDIPLLRCACEWNWVPGLLCYSDWIWSAYMAAFRRLNEIVKVTKISIPNDKDEVVWSNILIESHAITKTDSFILICSVFSCTVMIRTCLIRTHIEPQLEPAIEK